MEARQGRDLAPPGSVHDSHSRRGTHKAKPVTPQSLSPQQGFTRFPARNDHPSMMKVSQSRLHRAEAGNHTSFLERSVSAEANAVACLGVNLKRDSSILIEITPLDSVSRRTA